LLDFYRELFGWTTADSGEPSYTLVDTGGGEGAIGGGIGATQSSDESGGVTVYMKVVADLQAYLDKAEQLGGQTVLPPTELPGDFGRFALFTDPAGNTLGLWS
jgi:predicted enzyme related to lactoylglutathione lyase